MNRHYLSYYLYKAWEAFTTKRKTRYLAVKCGRESRVTVREAEEMNRALSFLPSLCPLPSASSWGSHFIPWLQWSPDNFEFSIWICQHLSLITHVQTRVILFLQVCLSSWVLYLSQDYEFPSPSMPESPASPDTSPLCPSHPVTSPVCLNPTCLLFPSESSYSHAQYAPA